ncbi:MAG: hypothetical protein WDO74_07955 [Pseudomonadota bacterium]
MLRRLLADATDPDPVFGARAEPESGHPSPRNLRRSGACRRIRLACVARRLHRLLHPIASTSLGLQQIFATSRSRDRSRTHASAEYTLRTALQPVLSLAHHKPVGYEALLRAYDAQDRLVSPASHVSQGR